jgi:transposase
MATVTILSGRERRRRWSAEERARIVEESSARGAVVAEVARRHDVHPNLLHHWRRQARLGGVAASRINFLPVAVATRSPGATRSGTIEIELDGRLCVRVDATVDEGALGRVLRVLGR